MTTEGAAPPPASTVYDAVAYPTALFGQTAPDRMATIAITAGLDPPPIATARVLELGAGDGMNLIALAAAWPEARFVGFDLAASAVARGRELIAAARLANVRLEVLDVLDAADKLDGPFDYIIAHGLYAWVPAPVRAATMALIGALLAERGVAFVSYNALPGGYLRHALRDALRFAIEDIVGDDARLDAAYANLAFLAQPSDYDEAPQAALRYAARATHNQPRSVLHHDELGEEYHPQSLRDVVRAGAAVGLRYLGDAGAHSLHNAFIPDGFAPAADPEIEVVQIRQAEDYRAMRFFRATLLVRDGVRPSRRIDHAAMGRLFASTRCGRIDDVTFRAGEEQFELHDPGLIALVTRLLAASPARLPVAEIAPDDALRGALFELFDAGYVQLHSTPAPFAVSAGECPRASPLARAMAAAGALTVAALDHRLVKIEEAGAAALIEKLDGTRDREALRAATVTGDADALLERFAREGLLLA